MADSLKDLINRTAQPGTVTWIGIRPERRAPMMAIPRATVTLNGLEGDRAKAGKRAVTLIQAEHLAVIGAFLGRDSVDPHDLRRNLVVRGINLVSLKGRYIQVGTATLAVTGPCAPCSRMEEAFGHGGYAAVRGHGGVTAQVISAGEVAAGDLVTPQDPVN